MTALIVDATYTRSYVSTSNKHDSFMFGMVVKLDMHHDIYMALYKNS